jgi:membrane protein implicated in regulation of membrane protease activity
MDQFLSPIVLWVILIIVFVVAEVLSLGLTSIWFAFGALFALIVSFFINSLMVQITVFVLSSVILLYFTKPIVKKYLKVGRTKTNVDSLIGMKGVVTEPITKHKTGQVKVNGQIWTAFSEELLEAGEEVIVIEVQGVKIKVKKEEN